MRLNRSRRGGTKINASRFTPRMAFRVVGFAPTYGRVSLRGIVPYAWSLDRCGPLTRTVEDATLVVQQIAGYILSNIDSVDRPGPDYFAGIALPWRNSASDFPPNSSIIWMTKSRTPRTTH
jgi:aspartyl-tRNA(Asn)/glutamyl-tRNA(Gln) amidotransferase subunit A